MAVAAENDKADGGSADARAAALRAASLKGEGFWRQFAALLKNRLTLQVGGRRRWRVALVTLGLLAVLGLLQPGCGASLSDSVHTRMRRKMKKNHAASYLARP